jgi:hypothetical protein
MVGPDLQSPSSLLQKINILQSAISTSLFILTKMKRI